MSRGARLGFDPFGRVALIQEGAYTVLNDTTWVDLADAADIDGVRIGYVVPGPEGGLYCAGRGAWGTAELLPTGRVRASSLVPANPPKWALGTSFERILPTAQGVYFLGWNGIVYWDLARRENLFFELPGAFEIFQTGQRVFVSSHGRPLHAIDLASATLRAVPGTDFGAVAAELATPLGASRTLLYVRPGRLLVFDGETATAWPAQARNGLTGHVAALHQLVDGGTAVAITGKGLFLLSADGELMLSLTTPQYHRITGLAAGEPGVIWVAVEDAIEKVLYGSPMTVFGQRLGLPLSWPRVVRWDGRIVVASGGLLYEAIPGPPGHPSHFEQMPRQPEAGVWAVAARGQRMLVGNSAGVFAVETDGRITPVVALADMVHLVMVADDLCYAIGQQEIGLLRWTDGRWMEAAPRVAGLGQSAVAHAAGRSAWIEFGGNRVARLTWQDGRLDLRTFDNLPWAPTQWVNIGVIRDWVVLTGAEGGRLFFDEAGGRFRDAPELARLLAQSPYWITRAETDRTGTIWATHSQGVVTFTPRDGHYDLDATSFDLINDYHPTVQVLDGDDVWFTAGRSLHHVERRRTDDAHRPLQPRLVSIASARTNAELPDPTPDPAQPLQLPFNQNNLRLRFFSGSYAWRRAPVYEFRLNGGDEWATLAGGSPLNLSGLREGTYRLDVRIAGPRGDSVAPLTYQFEILPPWYRTAAACIAYAIGVVLGVAGLVRWASHRSRHRNLALGQLVRERTAQLEKTMAKLNEETRIAATLSERNRLAGEIHDSLQQGLSGAILQLDTTLLLPAVAGQVRSRLDVVRNMLSFTRHEVQHAVWDMESPLLENTELGEALRKLTALINPGTTAIDVEVTGTPAALSSTIRHDLLRIAQEATTNAVRHASARRITIQLDYRFDAVALTVADDGVGFHPNDVLTKSVGHFGLRGLRGRVKRIHGELAIQSAPGQGTLIRVTAPLRAAPNLVPDAEARADR